MKLINETVYSSDDLRIFFFAALTAFGGDRDKTIRVAYSRRGGAVGGHAPLGRAAMHSARGNKAYHARQAHERNYMMIALPGPSYPIPSLHEVAHVVEHELAHNRGLNHGDMSERLMHWGQQKFPFVDELIVSGFQLHRKEDGTKVFIYSCRVHGSQLHSDHRLPWRETHCKVPVPAFHGDVEAARSCGVADLTKLPPVPCGWAMELKVQKKPEAKMETWRSDESDRRTVARAKAAEKREAILRERLAEAETELHRLKKRVIKLRAKVAYYDRRKAAKP